MGALDLLNSLSEHPTVIVGFVLGALAGWGLAALIYRARLTHKDEMIADLRERLGYVPRDVTMYSRLTNRELKERALTVIGGMRELGFRFRQRDKLTVTNRITGQDGTVEIPEIGAAIEAMKPFTTEYEERFQADARNLLEELRSRLPDKRSFDAEYPPQIEAYFRTMTPMMIAPCATHLEQLALRLPHR